MCQLLQPRNNPPVLKGRWWREDFWGWGGWICCFIAFCFFFFIIFFFQHRNFKWRLNKQLWKNWAAVLALSHGSGELCALKWSFCRRAIKPLLCGGSAESLPPSCSAMWQRCVQLNSFQSTQVAFPAKTCKVQQWASALQGSVVVNSKFIPGRNGAKAVFHQSRAYFILWVVSCGIWTWVIIREDM